MASKSFIIAALAVGCLFHVSAAAVLATPAAEEHSLNLTDTQWNQIFAEAQGGNVTELELLVDNMLMKVSDIVEFAEDNIELIVEMIGDGLTTLANDKLALTTQELLNRTTPLTKLETKNVVQKHLGAANHEIETRVKALTDAEASLAKV